MRKSTSGFTIVELLIVIVIIGILAAIVIVAYNGITQQARTAKTLSAIDAWAKAMQLYKAEKGEFPNRQSCLGSTTTYPGNDGLCWGDSYWDVKEPFLTMMQPYIGSSYPEPDVTPLSSGNFRGAFHIMRTEEEVVHRIRAMFPGESKCPASSIGSIITRSEHSTGSWCEYGLE